MKRKYQKKRSVWLMFLLIITWICSISTFAIDTSSQEIHYLRDEFYNAGKDTGFSEKNEITEKDIHYGWNLGEFYASGYTRADTDSDGTTVFLKNVGDKVSLSFELNQDIDILNGNKKLTIADDNKGYDQYFETEETDFGRGTLIIRKTDYKNQVEEPVIYADYLSGKTVGANVEVQLCEEGDYEVALDYSVKYDPRNIAGKLSILPKVCDYRIFFTFKVRNGNCMVYPFDVESRSELINTAITEHGFYLDLAKSRYLKINIKKEVLKEGAMGLTEDIRFNKPARDGEEFRDEGIYTISVKNIYTNQETIKKIYVGNDELLKAYMTTGLSIEEIQNKIANGATINEDGTINEPLPVESEEEIIEEEIQSSSETAEELELESAAETLEEVRMSVADESEIISDGTSSSVEYVILGIAIILLGIVLRAIFRKIQHKPENGEKSVEESTDSKQEDDE